MDKLESYSGMVPAVGFNSQRYDVDVIKTLQMRRLLWGAGGVYVVVKKNDAMTCMWLVDIMNYLVPGYGNDSYLNAFNL